MRRLALLLAGCAVWLFLAALPAFADGGPHVASVNNGSGGLNADSCAGCHRAHTAQTDRLLISSETALCMTCHGYFTTGATTNVVNGVQYVPASATDQLHRNPNGVILGALRDGGFVTAEIGSANEYKVFTSATRGNAKIPVRVVNGVQTGQPVTSAHMSVPGSPLSGFTDTTWGNITNGTGDLSNSVGALTGTMECTSCHNPHGNGQYRILQKQPAPANSTDFKGNAATDLRIVTDGPDVPTDPNTGAYTDTRNYTVIQTSGGTGTLLAGQVQQLAGYSNLMGDYLRKWVPWNNSSTGSADAPNGQPTTFNVQIAEWCTACHTRYLSDSADDATNTNNIFHNRHQTNPSHGAGGVGYVTCTTCHVAHGSNAQMTPGGYSAGVNYPGDTVGTASNPGDSRLLKADNRGICQACHDPTTTQWTVGQAVGGPLPANVPIVP